MSDPFSDATSQGALGSMDRRIAETAAALSSLKAPAIDAADAIDQAFAKAGTSLAKSLAKAASDGKISLAELASALITAVEQTMGGSNGGGLSAAVSQAVSSFSGARADGGPVNAGGGYLVGERGPEIFRPNSGGTIEATGSTAPNVSVNVMVSGGAQGLVRSEAQVAAALNRAARMGVR